MDLGRAIGYPMKDKDWIVKGLIGTVVSIIPIVNFISFGYILRAIQSIMNGDDETLPEWDDWGGDFIRGLMAFLGSLIYLFPMIIFACCFGIMAGIVGGEDGNALSTLISCCSNVVVLLYSLAASPMILIASVKYARDNDFGAFLNFGARFGEVTTHIGETFMFVLLLFVLYMVVGFVVGLTFWICGLGFFIAWIGYLAYAHLAAQYVMQIEGGKFKNA